MKSKLICQDFFYKSNGHTTSSKWNSDLFTFDNDVVGNERAIRVYGTKEQIDLAEDEYERVNGLMIDEVYNYKVEPKGSYWYDIGIITDEKNKEIAEKLVTYNELYIQRGRKALILRTR
tara:strand:+ start:96 stop:452 length:357 start_codon:yes stop_codon:yes gene_type:complete